MVSQEVYPERRPARRAKRVAVTNVEFLAVQRVVKVA